MASGNFVQRKKRPTLRSHVTLPTDAPTPRLHEGTEEILEDLDDLLDEVDSVLEEQTVLVNFRQRSGQ